MKKIFRIILMVLFPLGVVYCIGRNLFSGGFASFLGGVILFASGVLFAVLLNNTDFIQKLLVIFG